MYMISFRGTHKRINSFKERDIAYFYHFNVV